MSKTAGVKISVVSLVSTAQQNSVSLKKGNDNAAKRRTVDGMSVRASRADIKTPDEKIIKSEQAYSCTVHGRIL